MLVHVSLMLLSFPLLLFYSLQKFFLVFIYCEDKPDPVPFEINPVYYATHVPTPLFAALTEELIEKLLLKGANPNGNY